MSVYASDTTWNFDNASGYIYDTSKIEITGSVARLKNMGTSVKDDTIAKYYFV